MEGHLDLAMELGMEAVAVTRLDSLQSLQESAFDLVLICDSLEGAPLTQLLEAMDRLIDCHTPIILGGYRGRTVGVPARISERIYKPFIADQLAETALKLLKERGAHTSREPSEAIIKKPQSSQSGVRILLAEDNAIAIKVLKTLLLRKGHQVTEVKDGLEALQAVQANSFHLAFIDLRMPNMDGLEFTRRYRAMESDERHMPILALTANSAEDVLTQCIEAGMDGFLNKPAEPEQLDAVIARYVHGPEYRDNRSI
jgi:CheY-like chemotaxis protein